MNKFLLALTVILLAGCSGSEPQTANRGSSVNLAQGSDVRQLPPTKFVIDKEHTTILFSINHMGFSDKVGKFNNFQGYFMLDDKQPEKSYVDVKIGLRGIDSGSKALDRELQGKKWFDSAKFPQAHFRSTKIEVTEGNNANIYGLLTIKGITKPVTLRVKLNRRAISPIDGSKYIAGFKATTSIKRSEFGITEYLPMVGDIVRITIDTEGVAAAPKTIKKKPVPAVAKQ